MSLLQRWNELERKYAALSPRERALVAIAALAFVGYVGNALWVAPIHSRSQQFVRLTAQQDKEHAALQAQLDILQAQMAVDPNAPLQAKLAGLRSEMSGLDAQMAQFEQALVPPERMGAVLGNLLRQARGVRLVSLRTLPPEQVVAPKAEGETAGAARGNMYKHGFEMKVEGSYLDLLAYLQELERQPQRLLWQRAVLGVGDYPKSTLTVTFFSLSSDKDFLAL